MSSTRFRNIGINKNRMANNIAQLTEDILASYEARVQVVRNIIQDTAGLLDDFKRRREEMAEDLRDNLAKSEHLRKKDFDRMMSDILVAQNERENNVRKMLSDFKKEEDAMLVSLKDLLKKGRSIRLKDLKRFMVDIREDRHRREKETSETVSQELEKMQSEIGKMLDEFKSERERMSQEWNVLAGALSGTKEEVKALR